MSKDELLAEVVAALTAAVGYRPVRDLPPEHGQHMMIPGDGLRDVRFCDVRFLRWRLGADLFLHRLRPAGVDAAIDTLVRTCIHHATSDALKSGMPYTVDVADGEHGEVRVWVTGLCTDPPEMVEHIDQVRHLLPWAVR